MSSKPVSRPLHIGLWVVQVLFGLLSMFSGANKLATPIDELVKMGMTWAPEYGEGFVRFLGVCLVAGGLGLILPAATRVLPWLTPLAGAMLSLYFVLATGFHVMRGDGVTPVTIIFAAVYGFIAYGRFKLAPIAAKA